MENREFKLKPISAEGQDNAYLVADYPYGFRLRTQIRYWKEFKRGYGFRFVSQTVNPKTNQWNKPKAGHYHPALIIGLDEKGHVDYDVLNSGGWDKEPVIDAFVKAYESVFTELDKAAVAYVRATVRVNNAVKWQVVENGQGQTIEEQKKFIGKLVNAEIAQPGILQQDKANA